MRLDLGWPLDPEVTFLNHGSFGACPAAVLEVQQAWRDRLESEPVRFLARELRGSLDAARAAVGRVPRRRSRGLAFVPNATTGVNTVLQSLRFEPGDELLTNDHEYNARSTRSGRRRARRGAGRRRASPLPDRDAGRGSSTRCWPRSPRTGCAWSATSPARPALVLPIAELVRALDARGIDTLVDGAHAPGMLPLDLDALGAAYWTGNGHKWLCGPRAPAFLWVRADRRDADPPARVSHGANDPRPDRPRFRLEFDWIGHRRPDRVPELPAAIDWMARASRTRRLAGHHGREPALALARPRPAPRGARHPGARAGRDARLDGGGDATRRGERGGRDGAGCGTRVGGSDPGPHRPRPVRAAQRDGEAPQILLRISAQRYNEPADYERLANALVRRLRSN